MPAVRERMQIDLKDAMRSRDALRVDVLRRALSLIGNAEAVDAAAHPGQTEVARRELTADDVRRVLADEHADLLQNADLVRTHGADAEADVLVARAEILAAYLS